MKHSTKGILLSGLILPGLGQLSLKRYKRGISLMLMVFVSISYIVTKTVEQALDILVQLDVQSGKADINAITSAAAQASAGVDSLLVKGAFLVILACWIYAIGDAYVVGKKLDNEIAQSPARQTRAK